MLGKDILKHQGEFRRAFRNRHFEETETGLLFPQQKVHIHGSFESMVNGKDRQIDPNLVTTEGLTYMVGVALAAVAQIAAWYIAPFSGNITPQATLTGATFTATATEFTAYDESTRGLFVPGAVTANIDNSASRADFTMSTGVAAQTIYGGGVLSASAKSSVAGKCFAGTRFASPRTGLNAGDILSLEYDLASSST